MVVNVEFAGQVVCFRTLGLEQGEIIGTCRTRFIVISDTVDIGGVISDTVDIGGVIGDTANIGEVINDLRTYLSCAKL